jgi:predicted Zn-dependent protease
MKHRGVFPSLACALLLSACATDGPQLRPDKPFAATLESAMTEAARASATGQQDRALVLLCNAASTYPAEKGPWLTMAQMKFDRANYGEAILHAQEALQRDPADQVGSSIIAVSGLRLSTKALADLIQQNNLGGSLRDEAQGLARMLRSSLGEDVLVPPPVRPVRAPQGNAGKRTAPPAKPAVQSGADPFGAIR